jgi:cytochrome c556
MRKTSIWAIAMGAAIIAAAPAWLVMAQDKAAVIKDRHAFMKQQGEDLKAITGYAKGEADQAAAQAAIKDLLDRSQKLLDVFPPGTSLAEFPDATEAKPDIWKNWDEFKTRVTALRAEEEKLADAITAGAAQTGQQLASLGKNGCGACHTTFRQKKS